MQLIKDLLESKKGVTVSADKKSNTFTVKLDGKAIGSVWQDDNGEWQAEYDATGASWDGIDSKQDAIDMVTDQLNESVALGSAQIAAMKKSFEVLENNLEKVGSQLKVGSQFSQRLEKVGGDMKHFESIVKKFDVLFEDVMELVMHTHISMDGDKE